MHARERAIFMEENQSQTESKSPGTTPTKIANYQKIAVKSDKIINKLFELLDSHNENIALGAANKLIDKILPDLRATELTGENNGPILIRIVPEINGITDRPADQELPKTAIDI